MKSRCSDNSGGGVWVLLAERDLAAVSELQRQANEVGIPPVGAVFPAVLDKLRVYPRGLSIIAWRRMPPHVLLVGEEVTVEEFPSRIDDDPGRAHRHC